MKFTLTTSFALICQLSFSQHIQWQVSDESHTMNYEVQYSADSVTWVPIFEVAKGKLSYDYPPPPTNWKTGWYKVLSIGDSSFVVSTKIIISGNSVAITVPVYHSTSLTWKTAGEANVSYYLIEKTRTGKTTQVTKVTAKGSGSYTYRLSWTIYKYAYRVTPVYKDGTRGTITNFK